MEGEPGGASSGAIYGTMQQIVDDENKVIDVSPITRIQTFEGNKKNATNQDGSKKLECNV